MKNLDTVQSSKRIILWLITLIICPFQNVTSQNYCLTEQSSNREPQNLVLKTMSEQGPLYLRIYVHVIRKDDGTGGQSVPEVYEALSFLDLDFNPHNIFLSGIVTLIILIIQHITTTEQIQLSLLSILIKMELTSIYIKTF